MFHPRAYALKSPDKPAYIMAESGEVITFGKLESHINQCSHYLRHLGLEPKDHVCILMENNSRFLEVVLAAQTAGLYYTTISSYLKPGEIEYILNDSGSRVLITSHDMKDGVAELRSHCPKLEHILMVNGVMDGCKPYETEIAGFPETPVALCSAGRDMLYSSGTTGRPKGVVSTLEEVPFGETIDTVKLLMMLYNINEETIYLSTAPLYHAAPLRFCLWVLSSGGTVVVMKKFDALEALGLIEKYRITHSQWVPTMFIRMLKLPEEQRNRFDLSSHKLAIHAAAPCPVEVKEAMIQWWGPIIFEYYAGTEGNSFIAITSEEWMTHKGSVGRCFIGKAHILDEQGTELPQGQSGTIFIEGGNTFEYHNDPAKTAESRSAQGWNTIGDVGYLDEEEYLYLTDRKANMIISGGVNIYPQEVENLLAMHPKILDVAVFGIPNPDFGEEVKAVVELHDPEEAGLALEAELMAFCQDRLAKFKCPKSIDFTNELPRTPTGKLIKRLLKDRYVKAGAAQ
jgi:acyl-CoA synthetase (AMP-forming)/AMP-acid ligase II